MKRLLSTSNPEAAEWQRMHVINGVGCVVAQSLGMGFKPSKVHHLTFWRQWRAEVSRA